MDEETLEEAAKKRVPTSASVWDLTETRRNDFIAGAKWQQEKMYSAEDMRKAYDQGIDDSFDIGFSSKDDDNFNKWFEQFKNK